MGMCRACAVAAAVCHEDFVDLIAWQLSAPGSAGAGRVSRGVGPMLLLQPASESRDWNTLRTRQVEAKTQLRRGRRPQPATSLAIVRWRCPRPRAFDPTPVDSYEMTLCTPTESSLFLRAEHSRILAGSASRADHSLSWRHADMEELLKAIARDPQRFSEDVFLPSPLRQLADALTDSVELTPQRLPPAETRVVRLFAA